MYKERMKVIVTSTHISTSLGGHRRRPLVSPWLYTLKAQLAVGKKWDALPREVVKITHY